MSTPRNLSAAVTPDGQALSRTSADAARILRPGTGSGRRQAIGRAVRPWLYIAPVLALHAFTILIPALSGVYYSFTDWRGIGSANFVGFENYVTIAQDESFRQALLNNLKWLVFFWTVPFALGIGAAFLMSQARRGATLYRLSYFIPYVLPSVVVASLWQYLLDPDRGLPSILRALGVPFFDKALLGTEETALWTVAFIDSWHYWGFLAVILLVAMQSVPRDLYEAARLDGANRWQELVHVTVPGIRPTLLFLFMITGMWSFLTFDYVWVLTQGGPAGSSEVLGTYVYQTAFTQFNAGLGAAQGVSMALFASMLVGFFLVLRRRGWEI